MPVEKIFIVYERVGVTNVEYLLVRCGRCQPPQSGVLQRPQCGPQGLVFLTANVEDDAFVHLTAAGDQKGLRGAGVWGAWNSK